MKVNEKYGHSVGKGRMLIFLNRERKIKEYWLKYRAKLDIIYSEFVGNAIEAWTEDIC